MKKVYLAPQTETIQLISENVIMAGSITIENPIHGTKGGFVDPV